MRKPMNRYVSSVASRALLIALVVVGCVAVVGCQDAAARRLDQEQLASERETSPVCGEITVLASRPAWLLDEVVTVAPWPGGLVATEEGRQWPEPEAPFESHAQ